MDFIDRARITPCSKPKVWNHDIVITNNPDVSKVTTFIRSTVFVDYRYNYIYEVT